MKFASRTGTPCARDARSRSSISKLHRTDLGRPSYIPEARGNHRSFVASYDTLEVVTITSTRAPAATKRLVVSGA